MIRAAEIFNRAASIDTAYAIRLEKRIPIGAGSGRRQFERRGDFAIAE